MIRMFIVQEPGSLAVQFNGIEPHSSCDYSPACATDILGSAVVPPPKALVKT